MPGHSIRAGFVFWITVAVLYGGWNVYGAVTAGPGSRHGFEVGGLGVGLGLVEAAYLGIVGAFGFMLAIGLVAALGLSLARLGVAGVLAGAGWALVLPFVVDMTLAVGLLLGHLCLILGAGALSLAILIMLPYGTASSQAR